MLSHSARPPLCGPMDCSPQWPVAHQAPLSTGFHRWEHWSGLPLPVPGDLPDPGIKPTSLASSALTGGFFATSTPWETPGWAGTVIRNRIRQKLNHQDQNCRSGCSLNWKQLPNNLKMCWFCSEEGITHLDASFPTHLLNNNLHSPQVKIGKSCQRALLI